MDIILVMFKADGTRRNFPIKKDRIVVGRKPTCDLRIPLSSVSRQHCEITIDGEAAVVRDLGSSNGTLHNRERVQEHELAPGDELTVGPVVFTVVIDGEPTEIEPVRTVIEEQTTDAEDASGDSAVTAAHDDESGASPEGEAAEEGVGAGAAGSNESASEEGFPDVDLDDPLAALERMAESGEDDDDEPLSLDELLDEEEELEQANTGPSADAPNANQEDTGEVEVILDDEDEVDDDEQRGQSGGRKRG